MRLTSLLLVPLLCALAGGCGQGDERREARAVAQAFAAALAERDGAAACAQLSGFAAEQVASQAGRPCAQAILSLELSDAPLTEVRVYVTSAQVERADGEAAYLDRTAAGWRLTAIGCRFEDGKPQDRPATCEAQA